MKNQISVFTLFLILLSSHSFSQNKLTYYGSNTFGYLTLDNSNFSFQTVNGISINQKIHFGIGIGLEQLDNYKYLPLFFETKLHLRDQDKSSIPFLSAMVGNEFSVFPHNHYGGITYGIRGGINHFFSPNLGITCSVGYRYAYLNSSKGSNGEVVLPVVYDKNLLEFRLGLVIR